MLKKILIGIAIVFVLLIAALIAIPYLFKDQINAAIKAEANKMLNAKLDYSDYDLSLIRSFPNLSFGLNDLSITGIDDFKGDTLVYIKNFKFSIDLMSVIKKEQYKINEISLISPDINAKVDKLGKSNWDIVKASSDTTKAKSSSGTTKFSLQIKKYDIENANITYDDQKGNTYASVNDLNFSGSGDVTQDNYKLITKTSIAALTVRSGAVSYLSKAKIEAKNDIDVDQKNSKYSFKSNEIDLNDLGLLFDGFIQTNKNDIAMDVAFKSKQAEFKSILSLIPAIYKKDFSQLKTSGSLALDGVVKGTYDAKTMPALKLNLKIDNAMFQYPSLPTAVTNINIAAAVDKPQGPMDLAIVDVSKLHAEIGTDPIDAQIYVSTPVSDPNVTAKINGRVDLATVPKLYPMEGLEQLTGLLVAKLDFKGRMSDIEKKNYQAVQADGDLKVTNMVYASKSTPMPVKVSDLGLTFSPKNVTLSSLNAVLGKSDFSASGTLDNFMGYLFSKGSLTGVITLRSNNFDANEWLTKDNNTGSGANKPATTATTPASTTQQQYFQVPKGIDFTANSQFGKISYAKIILTNVKGNIHLFDEAIHLDNLSANLLGGSANISALYSTKNTKTPKVTFSYDIKSFDMQQTANLVDMAQKMAPVLKYLQGSYSSNLIGTGTLKQDMSVDYNSLQGNGKVSIPSAKVVGLPILQKIAEVTKIKQLDNLAITNAFTVLKFTNGRVNVDPTELKLGGGYTMNIQGSNGFDETIDYDVRMDIPTKELGPAASDLINKIPKIPGVNFKLPETISVTLKVGGTVTKPTVGIGKVGGKGASAGDMVKDVLKNAEDQAKTAAQKAADDEMKKIQKEGADKAAKDAADQLKNAAKGFKLPF
jgi:uncharacterized protein involved in outer membrane biogenesis